MKKDHPEKIYHSHPWDQRVFVLSGTGKYYHKENSTEYEDGVGDTGELLEVFVPANTDHYWEADQGNDLSLLSHFTVPQSI